MKAAKKKALEEKGYTVGSVDEFLGLTKQESEIIEMKLALAKGITELRKKRKLTQVQVAGIVGSSQSRIAKIERGDPSVSIDLMVKTLLFMGAGRKALARLIAA
jgi:DNA-binding XRE family transcriptional regulator